MNDDPANAMNFSEDEDLLTLENAEVEAAFRLATQQAVENNQAEFDFHGYTIEIDDAVEALEYISNNRTYH